jgi:hypothetical protein
MSADVAARSEWENTYAKGLKSLGFQYEERTKPFRGASGVACAVVDGGDYAVLVAGNEGADAFGGSRAHAGGGKVLTVARELQAQRVQRLYELSDHARDEGVHARL